MKPHQKSKPYSKKDRLARLAARAASLESEIREQLEECNMPDRCLARQHRWAREYLWHRRS
jgi:hypothetical protein